MTLGELLGDPEEMPQSEFAGKSTEELRNMGRKVSEPQAEAVSLRETIPYKFVAHLVYVAVGMSKLLMMKPSIPVAFFDQLVCGGLFPVLPFDPTCRFFQRMLTGIEIRYLLSRAEYLKKDVEDCQKSYAGIINHTIDPHTDAEMLQQRAYMYSCWTGWELHFRLLLTHRLNVRDVPSHKIVSEAQNPKELAAFRKTKLGALIYSNFPAQCAANYEELLQDNHITPESLKRTL